jgi:hypothetical protein
MKALCLSLSLVLSASAASAQVTSSEPPPGTLAAGQSVYVACGPGKARKITGGSDLRMGRTGNYSGTGSGKGRTRGPCRPYNGQ